MLHRPLATGFLLLGAAALGCDSKKPNASEDIFQSGGRDMSEQLDAYADAPNQDQPAEPETPAEETQDQQPSPEEPMDP